MLIKTLTGLTLLIHASIGPGSITPENDDSYIRLSLREKSAILDPLIHTATECVAQSVSRDPRLGKSQVTDLIVDSFKNCTTPVREMIDAHDRYFGPGSGEQFFMGPYLDALPATVVDFVGKRPR
jgi:hypothetical protein